MEKLAIGDHKCPPFYLNIHLLNKEAVVAKGVADKSGLKSGGFFGRAAASAANHLITDEKIIATISKTLIDNITAAVAEMGISCALEKSFQKGGFVVIKVEVADVDTLEMLLKVKGPKFASSFSALVASLNDIGMSSVASTQIDQNIKTKINEGLITKFAEMIPVKLAEKGVEVECKVCHSADQAEYFFSFLKATFQDL